MDIEDQQYRDRDGNIITLEKAIYLYRSQEYKVIQREEIGKYIVSTIWNPFYADFLFETMIFAEDWHELGCWRYSTEPEALEGHDRAVKYVKGFLE